MKYFVGVTDDEWFRHLSEIGPDEVNFWRPSGKSFGAIEPGAPFLFKLHSPLNYIVGVGFFVRSERLPLSLAWDAFGAKNGAASLSDLRRLINAHRETDEHDPLIGCVILNQPFFLPREAWITVPESWAPNIVTGKRFDTSEDEGKHLWERVAHSISFSKASLELLEAAEEKPVYGAEYLSKSRLGQGAFRVLVTSAYKKRCAVTGEKTLPVLEAAHIKPITDSGPNRVNNGLLLRSDLHILFDRGYLTVTPDRHVEISRKIKDEFDNGREYYPLHGRQLIIIPDMVGDQPRDDYLRWHNENIYLV